MIGAVILAAGAGARVGFPKALLAVEGRSLLDLHEAWCLSSCPAVVSVIGAEALSVESILPRPRLGVSRVRNSAWKHGPFSSLLVGLSALLADHPLLSACCVLPVDTTPLRSSTLTALLTFATDEAWAVVPRYNEQRGHPVLLGRALVDQLLALDPQLGRLDLVLRTVPGATMDIDDPAIATNLNTAALLERHGAMRFVKESP